MGAAASPDAITALLRIALTETSIVCDHLASAALDGAGSAVALTGADTHP
jgi:hypothetical protein